MATTACETVVTLAVAVMYWTAEPDPNEGPMTTMPIAATPTTIRPTAARIFRRMCAPFDFRRMEMTGPKSGLARTLMLAPIPDDVLNAKSASESAGVPPERG